jgi:hypothetical protein
MGSVPGGGKWKSETAPRQSHFAGAEQTGELYWVIAHQNPNEFCESTMVWPKEIARSIV